MRSAPIILAVLLAACATGCGGSSGSSSSPASTVGVITHPEDFYIYFYDRNYQQLDGTLVQNLIFFDIQDTWNHTNQAEGNTPFASHQGDDGGRIHVFWEIGRKGSTEDAETFQSHLTSGGVSAAFTLYLPDDQKTATYLPQNMNFGLAGQLVFSDHGDAADLVLGQSGDAPWNEIRHQIRDAMKDSVYADAFAGANVDEDLETFEHVTDVIADIAGFHNVWSVGANGTTVNGTPYPAAMINWNDHSIPHCRNPHQAMLVPLLDDGLPSGRHILVMPRDCNVDHEIAVVLWDFSLD